VRRGDSEWEFFAHQKKLKSPKKSKRGDAEIPSVIKNPYSFPEIKREGEEKCVIPFAKGKSKKNRKSAQDAALKRKIGAKIDPRPGNRRREGGPFVSAKRQRW